MLRNMRQFGLSFIPRHESQKAHADVGDRAIRLEPVGRNLPERRSQVIDAGNLTGGRIMSILQTSSSSGAPVSENSSLGVSAVYSCVSLLADMIAKLPVELYTTTDNGPKQVTDHAGANLMASLPSDMHTSFELRQLMQSGKILGGNGYARIFRDAGGDPVSIEWLAPCDVQPKAYRRSSGQKSVSYQVQGEKNLLTSYDIIHIKGLSRDGISGISPITLLRESIGTSMSQTEAAGKLMRNGAKFPGYLTTSQNLKPDQLEDARNEFNSKYAGALNAGTVPVLNGMFDFKQTNGMSMSDAQFIESRRFELQEIARHYRIPPFLIGDSTASTTWGTGIQEQTLGFLNFCLDPHLKSFEEALNRTLLTTAELRAGYYFRFDRDELASVSRQDTAAYFQTMRNIGVYSVNDIRAKLDEPLISDESGGNDYGKPFNTSAKAAPEPKKEAQMELELETKS